MTIVLAHGRLPSACSPRSFCTLAFDSTPAFASSLSKPELWAQHILPDQSSDLMFSLRIRHHLCAQISHLSALCRSHKKSDFLSSCVKQRGISTKRRGSGEQSQYPVSSQVASSPGGEVENGTTRQQLFTTGTIAELEAWTEGSKELDEVEDLRKNGTLSSWKNAENIDEFSRSGNFAPSDRSSRRGDFAAAGRRGSVAGGEEQVSKESIGEQERAAAFELWAANKLKQEGRSALPAIEEMRQAFTPLTPKLQSKTMPLRETPRTSSLDLNKLDLPPLRSRAGETTGEMKPWRPTLRPEVRAADQYLGEGNPTTRIESWSPKSLTLSRAPSQRKGYAVRAERPPGKEGTEAKVEITPNPPVLQPLIVKRKTKLPINFHGKGGTVMLVDKPKGWSSFAVCAKLRYLLKIQKVGHAGTLDPMATGLLIICLGKATKLADSYQAMTKVYSGTIRLGELTPSLDSFTEVSHTLPWEHITDEDLEKAKKDFMGEILQTPPMYSAIKVDGERLYMKARRGEKIEVAPRIVTVTHFQLERNSENRQEVHFNITCSKGTYVRSLCFDLAQAVGSYAHLTSLRREKIGTYSVTDAWPIEEFAELYPKSS